MTTIIGIDIGRGTAVCCALTEFSPLPLKHFHSVRDSIKKLECDADGVAWLLAQKPDGLVMEPTGRWYSAFWAEVAQKYDIPIYWVGHSDLAAQRKAYGFKNKKDPEDAYCLALTYFDDRFINYHGERRFLTFSPEIHDIRNLWFEIEQIDKQINALTNRIRQRLSFEFPEAASRQSNISEKLGYAPMWGYLSGVYSYRSIQNLDAKSAARTLGIELSERTREMAYEIMELQIGRSGRERRLSELMAADVFAPYMEVFYRYGFGPRTRALLLIQCYPIEKFLVNGHPWIDRTEKIGKHGRKTISTRNKSCKSFQLFLGTGRTWSESGEHSSWVLAGSDICRAHLYCWAVTSILPDRRAGTWLVERLNVPSKEEDSWTLDGLKASNVPGKSKVIRLLLKITRWLFFDLLESTGND